MGIIRDPFNDNEAIVDGQRAVAVRWLPAGSIANPAAPRLSELSGGTIFGYEITNQFRGFGQ